MKTPTTPSLQDRAIDNYMLPQPEGFTPLHPERTALSFGKGIGALDFGARCYLRRAAASSKKRGTGIPVDLASFDAGRQRHIRLAVETLLTEARLRSRTLPTLNCDWSAYLRFIDWCDATGRHDALDDQPSVQRALKAYVGHLRERTRSKSKPLNVNTAAGYQNRVIGVLKQVYGFDGLGAGINLLFTDERQVNSTEVPDEAAVARVLSWCECLLSGFSDLLVSQKPYPFALPVPGYLEVPKNRLWVFPATTWAVMPGKSGSSLHVDYENGRIRMPEELYSTVEIFPSRVRQDNQKIRVRLNQANTDPWHHSRVERGLLAMKAYLLLLIATSGQNPSVVVNLPWSEELEEQVLQKRATRQQFRTIKYRAAGSEITFEVGLNHVRLLRSYLQLRSHLLPGRQCDRLFFGFGHKQAVGDPDSLDPKDAIKSLYRILRTFDPLLPKVAPRAFRAAKADFLIRITDAATAATLMQHSQKTADRNYREGSQATHKIEISTLFKRIEEVVSASREDDPTNIQQRAAGGCASPQHPKPIIDNPPAVPDCKHPEGCFFCDKYHAHADEQDVHKLLSARLCISYRARRAGVHEDYERNYRPVLDVIDILVNRIRELRPDVVAAVERRVEDEGDLTPYWATKMRVLVELEGLL